MWLESLKKMKKISGKTSKQISEETGISKSTIDKLFAGQTKEPFLTSTKAIVHSMGFTLDDLYDLSNSQSYTQVESKLISNYRLLNDSGKEKLLEYSEDLIGNAKYTTPDFSDIKEKHAWFQAWRLFTTLILSAFSNILLTPPTLVLCNVVLVLWFMRFCNQKDTRPVMLERNYHGLP